MTNKRPTKKIRVDLLLLEKKYCLSIKEAQALIYTGKVYTTDRKLMQPSELIDKESFVALKQEKKSFVSRGGDKLFHALVALKLLDKIKDRVVLDIGSSTGGFTDCLLQHGAKKVIALDVGSNQLSWTLRQDKRVISVEQTNIKNFNSENYPSFDLIVADISFNSLEKLAPFIAQASQSESTELLLLVKPQFELPRNVVPQGGVVENTEDRKKAIQNVSLSFTQKGFDLLGEVDSKIKGRSGNLETFLHFKKKQAQQQSF